MFKKILVIYFFLAAALFCGASLVQAQTIIPPSHDSADYCPPGYEGNCGNYEINDFVLLAVNASKWILGIVGSLSLVMFVYGGLTFMLSAGSSEKVSQAQKIIVAAVVGLIIVFASYLIIKFVLRSIGLDWDGRIAQPRVAVQTIILRV